MRRRWVRWMVRGLLATLAAGLLLVVGSEVWIQVRAAGRTSTVDGAPAASVAIVFGAQLASDGAIPMPVLANRLDTAIRLHQAGKVRAILVSGDAAGFSGDEVTAMTRYLTDAGIPAHSVVADPYGLDTYDTCARANTVYGVTDALLVTQGFHLDRAIALCRHAGLTVHGVLADCVHCRRSTIVRNTIRDWLAAPKAAYDAARDRPPAVNSPPDPALREASR